MYSAVNTAQAFHGLCNVISPRAGPCVPPFRRPGKQSSQTRQSVKHFHAVHQTSVIKGLAVSTCLTGASVPVLSHACHFLQREPPQKYPLPVTTMASSAGEDGDLGKQ